MKHLFVRLVLPCIITLGLARIAAAAELPLFLGELSIFRDLTTLEPATELHGYEVQVPLWSDGAEKKRYLFLPSGTQIDAADSSHWELPRGALLVKHFGLGTRRIETRVIRRENTGWTFGTYLWSESQNDAILTDGGADLSLVDSSGARLSWRVPSVQECTLCHTDQAYAPLGFKTAQFGQTQLESWIDQLRIINSEDPVFLHYFPAGSDPQIPGREKARAYLDANCAHCHSPGGYAPGGMDMRESTAEDAMALFNVWPSFGDLGHPNAMRVKPGSKDLSVLWHRIRSTDENRMPAMGSRRVDSEGSTWIGEWIDSLIPTRSGIRSN